MGLENVKVEILASARKEAEAIIAKANAEVSEIAKQVKQEIDAEKVKCAAKMDAELKLLRENELSKARLEARKTILHMKSRLIEEVFAKAKKEIEHSGKEARKKHMAWLLSRAKKAMDIRYIELNSHDIELLQSGEMGGIEARESGIIGGLKAHNAEGTLSLDLSYEACLDEVKEKAVGDIAEILFGGGH
ncbi:hypothetical protein HYU13_01865 [Candidatus Woesearchaeota archaeon]|nr:hypothetical protein [Candidatus Woesearchaeota archaeon]